jgi:hypothetical protein
MARTSWGLSRISGEIGAARQRCPRLWRVRCVFMSFEPPCAIPLTTRSMSVSISETTPANTKPWQSPNERFRPPGLSRAQELISLCVSLGSPRLNAAVGSDGAKPAAAAARLSDGGTGVIDFHATAYSNRRAPQSLARCSFRVASKEHSHRRPPAPLLVVVRSGSSPVSRPVRRRAVPLGGLRECRPGGSATTAGSP